MGNLRSSVSIWSSETSTLKQAFQLQTSFLSGPDPLSIFWSKQDSQRRGSSIGILRMDEITRKTLTIWKPYVFGIIMVRRVKQVHWNKLFNYKHVVGVVRILFRYFGPKRIPKEDVPTFGSLGWTKSWAQLWHEGNLYSNSIWSREWNKYFETSFSCTNKFLEWYGSSFDILVQTGFQKKRFLPLDL